MKNSMHRMKPLSLLFGLMTLVLALYIAPTLAQASDSNPYIKGNYTSGDERYIDIDAAKDTVNPWPQIISEQDIAAARQKAQSSGKHFTQLTAVELTFADGSTVIYKNVGQDMPGRHYNPVKIRVFIAIERYTNNRIGWHNQEFLNVPEYEGGHLINVSGSKSGTMIPYDIKINGYAAPLAEEKRAGFAWGPGEFKTQYIEYSLDTPKVWNDLQIMPMIDREEGGSSGVSTMTNYMGARNGDAFGEFHAVDDFLYRAKQHVALDAKIPGRNAGLAPYSFAAHKPLDGLTDLRPVIETNGFYSSYYSYTPTILRPEGEAPAYKSNWKPSPREAVHYYMLYNSPTKTEDIALANQLRPSFADVTAPIDGYVYKDNDIDFPAGKTQFDNTDASIKDAGNQYLFVGVDENGEALRTKYYYITYRPYAIPLEISKVDEAGKPLAGVEFEIYHEDSTEPMLTLTTNAEGKIVLGDVNASRAELEAIARDDAAAATGEKGYYEKDGKQWLLNGHHYTIKEKAAPAGYTKAADQSFTASLKQGESDLAIRLQVVNTKTPVPDGPGNGNNPPVVPIPDNGGSTPPVVPAANQHVPTTFDATISVLPFVIAAVAILVIAFVVRRNKKQ